MYTHIHDIHIYIILYIIACIETCGFEPHFTLCMCTHVNTREGTCSTYIYIIIFTQMNLVSRPMLYMYAHIV